MKSAVITGGDGFIGSHLTKYLVQAGYEVFDIVIPSSPIKYRIENLEHVHIIEGDLNNYESFIKDLPDCPSAFFHFAWDGVSPEFRNDFSYQNKNIELSLNTVQLASKLKAEKFIFPGSTMEYVYYGKPLDKNAVPSPLNAYGVAKISARYACSIRCDELKVPFIYTVITGVYSEDRNDNNVIYYTISKLLHNERPSLTKLEQLWDYIHIDDVVYALKLIAEKGEPGSFYSLGHGDNWKLSNYIEIIHKLIDPNIPLGIGDLPYSNDKLPCSCVNLQPLYEDTGYIPKVSFEEGIERVINEVKKREFGA